MPFPVGKVLIVEDDKDLASTYNQVFALFSDCKVVIAESLSVVEARREEALSCSVAILDINLGEGEPSGIDVYIWLRRSGFLGSVFFMTGHGRSHPLVAQAVAIGEATVLEKPFDIERLIQLISEKEASGGSS